MNIDVLIKEVIADQLDELPDNIEPLSILASLDAWDSLTALRVMTTIELRTGKKISLQQFFNAKTVSEIIELVKIDVPKI